MELTASKSIGRYLLQTSEKELYRSLHLKLS